VQAHAGIPKADLARAYGISRETVYQTFGKTNQVRPLNISSTFDHPFQYVVLTRAGSR
jgi:Helix-turn-helix domain of resolvase